MTGGIFISYRREDSAGFARLIYDRIVNRIDRERVFFDVDNIEPGLDFEAVLSERVGNCDALVAIIGRQWTSVTDEVQRRRIDNPEDFVRIEIAAALERGVRVIPVLVDGARMPRSEELPDGLKSLAKRQAIEISHTRFDSDTDHLTRWLHRVEEQRLARIEEEKRAERERAALEERERRELKEAQAFVEGPVKAVDTNSGVSILAIENPVQPNAPARRSRPLLLGSLILLAAIVAVGGISLAPWARLPSKLDATPARVVERSGLDPTGADTRGPVSPTSNAPPVSQASAEPTSPVADPSPKAAPSAVTLSPSDPKPAAAPEASPPQVAGAVETIDHAQDLTAPPAAGGSRPSDSGESRKPDKGVESAANPPAVSVEPVAQEPALPDKAPEPESHRPAETFGPPQAAADALKEGTRTETPSLPSAASDGASLVAPQVALANPGSVSPESAQKGTDSFALVAPILVELRRIGCYSGLDDGWEAPSVKAGVANYALNAHLIPTPVSPDAALLDALKAQRDRVCPLECARGEVAINGRCAPKSCAKGETLTHDGACKANPPPPRVVAAPRKDASPSLRSACFFFNGAKYCQ